MSGQRKMIPDGAHETKAFRAEFKAGPEAGLKAGQFQALVSVFGNVDHGGDRVMPGAFDKSLADLATSGDPLPIIWSHQWDNPDAHIGYAMPDDVTATESGLLVTASLDVDRPFAGQVHHLLTARRVKEFSFGYIATGYEWVKDPDEPYEVRNLTEVSIFEAGPTLLGMNPGTQLIAAASRLTPPPADADPEAKDTDPTGADAGDGPASDSSSTIDPERFLSLAWTRHKE